MPRKETLIPLGNRILVSPILESKESKIVRPDTAKSDEKPPEKGVVIALGSSYEGELKVGDTVYFERFGPEKIVHDGQEFRIGLPEVFLAKIK